MPPYLPAVLRRNLLRLVAGLLLAVLLPAIHPAGASGAAASQFGLMAVFGEERRLFLPILRSAFTPHTPALPD